MSGHEKCHGEHEHDRGDVSDSLAVRAEVELFSSRWSQESSVGIRCPRQRSKLVQRQVQMHGMLQARSGKIRVDQDSSRLMGLDCRSEGGVGLNRPQEARL